MKVFRKISAWSDYRKKINCDLGFVPTMGALHEGHLSLVERSKQLNDYTVVSIFVNPTQFNQKEDLKKYPRDFEKDIKILEDAGCDAVIFPFENDIYKDGYSLRISESEISSVLEGEMRPGHFDGVLTVVAKLFGIVKPRRAFFGEKDYQQLMLVKKLSESLFMDIEIIGCPVVREKSGLALSSRNALLSSHSRKKASMIYKSLMNETTAIQVANELTKAGFKVEYSTERWGRRLVAASIDGVRLIDNIAAPPPLDCPESDSLVSFECSAKETLNY